MTNLIIEIPVTIDCVGILIDSGEPGHLGDFREATVDEQAIRVRMAGLTSLERDLLAVVDLLSRYDENVSPALLRKLLDSPYFCNLIVKARATIAKAGGAK